MKRELRNDSIGGRARAARPGVFAMALLAALAGGLGACAATARSGSGEAVPGSRAAREAVVAAPDPITVARLEAHLAFLADDLLAGRFTGTGEYEVAARYVAAQLQQLGLRPIASQGYLLPVPLVAAELEADSAQVELLIGGQRRSLAWREQFVMPADVTRESSAVEGPLVFVGHGVVAPELGWDDYAGLDVEGRVVLVMSGAPAGFPSQQRAHHGRTLLKKRHAAARGAVAMIGFRSAVDAARRPWERMVLHAGTRPEMEWLEPDGTPHDAVPELRGSATLSDAAAAELFQAVGREIEAVQAAATQAAGRGFALPARARLASRSRISRLQSSNVAAILPGADRGAAEAVVFTAHLDHLGRGRAVDGDAIYNGFYDNAMGVALLIELARGLAAQPQPPRRTLVFLAVTGEERGLLGSAYFAHHPPAGLPALVANVNLDMPLFLDPVGSVVAFGAEHSTLEPLVRRAVAGADLRLIPDPMPEEVVFVRSDQYSFVQRGIPAVFLVPARMGSGAMADAADRNRGAGSYLDDHYHMPSDQPGLPVDWPSALRFLHANLLLGRAVADAAERPRWHAGDFFGETFGRRWVP